MRTLCETGSVLTPDVLMLTLLLPEPILIGPTHTLVYRSSASAHHTEGQTYSQTFFKVNNPLTTRVPILIGSSYIRMS